MYHLLAYSGLTGAAPTNFDMSAVVDPEFTARNNHFVFSEDYRLLAAAAFGATLTRSTFSVPTWNAIALANLWPINGALLPPSNPQVHYMLNYPMPLPKNEEFAFRTTNTGAGEQNTGMMIVAPMNWTQNIPRGRMPIMFRATAAVTLVANAWSATVAITLEQALRGGVYAIYGMDTICTNGQFARLVFPRAPLVQQRKMRPGWLCLQTVTNQPNQMNWWELPMFGEWGRFHTFELPQIEIMGSTAGAQTAELRIYAVYMGEDMGLLGQAA